MVQLGFEVILLVLTVLKWNFLCVCVFVQNCNKCLKKESFSLVLSWLTVPLTIYSLVGVGSNDPTWHLRHNESMYMTPHPSSLSVCSHPLPQSKWNTRYIQSENLSQKGNLSPDLKALKVHVLCSWTTGTVLCLVLSQVWIDIVRSYHWLFSIIVNSGICQMCFVGVQWYGNFYERGGGTGASSLLAWGGGGVEDLFWPAWL